MHRSAAPACAPFCSCLSLSLGPMSVVERGCRDLARSAWARTAPVVQSCEGARPWRCATAAASPRVGDLELAQDVGDVDAGGLRADVTAQQATGVGLARSHSGCSTGSGQSSSGSRCHGGSPLNGAPASGSCVPRSALVGVARSVSFAQGTLDQQFAEITAAVQHREKDNVTRADGEHQPIRAHAQVAVAIDPFSLELRDDTASKGHGRKAGHTARDLPVETLGRLGSVPLSHVVDDAQKIIDGGLGPLNGEAGAHDAPRRSAKRALTSPSTDAWSCMRPAR